MAAIFVWRKTVKSWNFCWRNAERWTFCRIEFDICFPKSGRRKLKMSGEFFVLHKTRRNLSWTFTLKCSLETQPIFVLSNLTRPAWMGGQDPNCLGTGCSPWYEVETKPEAEILLWNIGNIQQLWSIGHWTMRRISICENDSDSAGRPGPRGTENNVTVDKEWQAYLIEITPTLGNFTVKWGVSEKLWLHWRSVQTCSSEHRTTTMCIDCQEHKRWMKVVTRKCWNQACWHHWRPKCLYRDLAVILKRWDHLTQTVKQSNNQIFVHVTRKPNLLQGNPTSNILFPLWMPASRWCSYWPQSIEMIHVLVHGPN